MNDRIDEVDTHAVTSLIRGLSFDSVEHLFLLATNEGIETMPHSGLATYGTEYVAEVSGGFSDAVTMWLTELFGYGRIHIRQLTSATRTYHTMHPQVQVLLYETVYETVYPHPVEGLV